MDHHGCQLSPPSSSQLAPDFRKSLKSPGRDSNPRPAAFTAMAYEAAAPPTELPGHSLGVLIEGDASINFPCPILLTIMKKHDLLLVALTIALGDPEIAEALLKAFSKGEVETMELIELLDMSPADVRRILYRLHDLNLAFQIVRKGEEGERLVFWVLNEKIAPSFVERRLKRTKKVLEEEVKIEEGGEYYVCAADPSHIKISFEEAAFGSENGFLCPVCGASLIPVDREKAIEKIKEAIRLIDALLKEMKHD